MNWMQFLPLLKAALGALALVVPATSTAGKLVAWLVTIVNTLPETPPATAHMTMTAVPHISAPPLPMPPEPHTPEGLLRWATTLPFPPPIKPD